MSPATKTLLHQDQTRLLEEGEQQFMKSQPMQRPQLLLNYLPIRFTSDAFEGGTITFANAGDDRDPESPIAKELRALRAAHRGSHVFYRSGNLIHSIPLAPEHPPHGTKATFHMQGDFQLANALAREALLHFFHDAQYTITDIRPITLLLTDRNLATQRPDVFGIYPEYALDIRPLAPHEGDITSGVLVEFSMRTYFLKTAAELQAEGVNLQGLCVCMTKQEHHELVHQPFTRRYVGTIESVNGTTATLADADVATIDLATCYLEADLHTRDVVAQQLLGADAARFITDLQQQTFAITGAEHQLDRLRKLGEWLERKSPFACCPDMKVRIHATPHECQHGIEAGEVRMLAMPRCYLRPGGSISVTWPIDKQIDMHGPYDAESFPDKRVRIAVICPQEFTGDVEQFLGQLRDGINSTDERAPFQQGFLRKYHLTKCDFTIHEVKPRTALHEAYKDAALEALQREPHLSIVVIREQHADLPDETNPYYVTKAALMSQGVPVQVMEIETLRRRNAYILNNVALAMYAKLGGIPWVLASKPEVTHEIIVGIGSAVLQKSRHGFGDRVIGITTVFSGDGQYLLANNTREVTMNEYIPALTGSLHDTVAYLRKRYGWQQGDRVRFVFHQSFKKYKDIEAEAVKQFSASLTEFDVQYAFVHVSSSHNWRLFDARSDGVPFGNTKKGKSVPSRGAYVPLGPYTALVTLTGPYQLKTPSQGCPHPILVNVHEDSTFKSLDYLAGQVFDLSFMSWRGFNPSTQPVSIAYSDMIVGLLSHLRHVKNWNPDTLNTKLRHTRWFL